VCAVCLWGGGGSREREIHKLTDSRFLTDSVRLLVVTDALVGAGFVVLAILEGFEVIDLQMTVPSWLLSMDESDKLRSK